jgi:protein-disulfide isomerase
VEARGTPHFFLNGVRLSGAQPFAAFEELFQRRRAQALSLVSGGVPREKVYEATIEKGKKATEPQRADVPAPDKATPVRGPVGARVTIQVWSDFQCPFCGRVLDTLRTLEKEFAGRVRVAWRHHPLPFHKDAPLASEAAQEVFAQRGSAAFFRYHDALFAAQSVPDGLGRANLEALAQRQGVNLRRFRHALDAHTHQPKVEADLAAAKQAGITGTPTCVINGYVVSGAQPITAFRRVVMRALAEQRAEPAKTKIVP